MTRFPASDVYITGDLADFLKGFDGDHKFHKWIRDMKAVLKEHMFSGDLVKKAQIPNYYMEKYQVNNLYRYEHPEGYRSCYTIVKRCAYVLDIMDHSEYDLRFGYNTT